MKYVVTLNGKDYAVEVDRGTATAVLTGNTAACAPAASANAPAASVNAPAASANAAGGESITSPMPGTILSIKCTQGQMVKRGDVLFILEAMKMENEIFAPHDGTISSISVTQGAAVDTGAVLCTL